MPAISVRILSAGIGLLLLAGCSMTKESAGAASGASPEMTEDASGILAKGGRSASGRYVDPQVSTARGQARAGASAAGQPAAASSTQAFPEPPPSIAGLASEPTGVRAGAFSIFSSAQPATAAPDGAQTNSTTPPPQATGTMPAERGVSAARRSVFSAAPAPAPTSCGTDAQGNPLNC